MDERCVSETPHLTYVALVRGSRRRTPATSPDSALVYFTSIERELDTYALEAYASGEREERNGCARNGDIGCR